jgi:putative holliday junction resolvase
VSRIVGVDYGSRRVGFAISDALGMTARPLKVVPRDSAVAYVEEVAEEYAPDRIVVGLPTSLRGGEGKSAEDARLLAAELTEATGIPVEFHDERFTSRMAESTLLASGMKRRKRRETVDKVAAAIILQDYLDHQ